MRLKLIILFSLLLASQYSYAELSPLTIVTQTSQPEGQTWSLPVETLVFLTLLTFIPIILLLMTSFTRIIIVLGLLRSALGTQSAPPNQLILGIALFMTFFIMSPTLDKIYQDAYLPYSQQQITMQQSLTQASKPLREFMLSQTRESDLTLFVNMSHTGDIQTREDIPLRVLVPAFVVSELKTAFQIGFTLFIPFLVIDLVVASTLMALGMMMVPPATVSLPFKIMLFVLADGWHLLLGSLAQSFFS
ncbi:flagellar type III secretion system pore protein FliP [Gilliamella apis]|uniref:flagellar type III secretion system pore protein FliP n=1 Tax=Gilliamella apis TaxID=1970738 RepID=UPI000D78906C|nr:flagellar type III secretion system pore protein FliP [Gilliamella apis]PXY90811.1 flagellar biosynthetic protein FliP [Gilliamella apis]WLS96510.1 flagellar type III secretion system pore protein FliP [Gilliamella apis]